MSGEAFIHARWHRALDDLRAEPDGPIRTHIEAHDARVRRDLAAKVKALADWWRRRALANPPGYDGVALYVAASELLALLADALPQDADSGAASVPLAAEDDSGAAVDVPGAAGLSEAQGGVTACNYGAHDFVLGTPDASPIGATAGMHLHICANCEATYYEHGGGPCWRCRSADTEMRDGGAGL